MEKRANIYRFINRLKIKSIDDMQTLAEAKLNPLRHRLSAEAKKRLGWMYIIHYECQENITLAAKKIGLSRTWLSTLHSEWERNNRDSRILEPESRAPRGTLNRRRIPKAIEDKIIKTRKKYQTWGKEKIVARLKNRQGIEVGASTVNRYLHKHGLINPRLSHKNKMAWRNKKGETSIRQKIKMRPPKIIKDYKPGALIEKDLKFVAKPCQANRFNPFQIQGNFWFQHSLIDSFTRVRALGLADDSESITAARAQTALASRLPFPIASMNTDSGSENGGAFETCLKQKDIIHFFSRTGTPTDNPRVERSHLTDDLEFYKKGNRFQDFSEQEQALAKWERIYNYERPHQALGYLTPIEFYELWKKDPKEAYAIKDKYQSYLERQRKRLSGSRRIKKKEQVEQLMNQIDKKLSQKSNH